MRRKAKAVVAVTISAVLACGTLAGCQFVTTNTSKDFSQVVAEIDITKSKEFQDGGEFAAYKNVIEPSEVLKRDLVATFVSNYDSYQQSGSYADTFKQICNGLVNQQIYVQYAKAYLMKQGDAEGKAYTPEGYAQAVANKDDALAGIKYFLTETEIEQGLYLTRLRFNNTLDSNEKTPSDEEGSSSSVTARTTPTGVSVSNSDYYEKTYRIYTGFNSASECGSYRPKNGSTVTSRKEAYSSFLGGLERNDLLKDGEDTTDVESLSYFELELRSQYESTLLQKLTALFRKEAEPASVDEWLSDQFESEYARQKESYEANPSSFDSTKLDSISDTSFLLTAPEENFGYVVNILLPFSASQTATLKELKQDYGDTKGNKFQQRAGLLKKISATDQRESWFTGDTDYSFDATADTSSLTAFYNGGNADRKYLFFEDSLIPTYTQEYFAAANDTTKKNYTDEYTAMSKYFGRYSFNGKVTYDEKKETYSFVKEKIDIDDFMTEMKNYMNYAFGEVFGNSSVMAEPEYPFGKEGYFTRPYSAYYTMKNDKIDTVDYSAFVYCKGNVAIDNYDPNKIFVGGTNENLAFSVINELSFAYNTDTGGLNPYLGYSVVTNKTNYMTEFEYAAQEACKDGAGSYYVVPTDYGWHIIYCTFSFKDGGNGIKPFTFNAQDKNTKGSFSNLFYESWKSTFVSKYATNMNADILAQFNNEACVTVYESRYASFAELDNA